MLVAGVDDPAARTILSSKPLRHAATLVPYVAQGEAGPDYRGREENIYFPHDLYSWVAYLYQRKPNRGYGRRGFYRMTRRTGDLVLVSYHHP
ncbi:hypothetical protein EVAR_6557_1 [Eumeta japonica]|uniref:Uncharacterized protein n=1 Tax=Eumeta variegata TaxID=151549 RepID=A0A4C1STI7_EUMVA|nr:hypothetical protein EVAR_6557_1 [Eumeta japonica]